MMFYINYPETFAKEAGVTSLKCGSLMRHANDRETAEPLYAHRHEDR